jgi:hypothetical protein
MARCGNSRLAPFDVNTAIADVLTLTRGELQRHDVSLETELSPGLEPVLADRAQLQQVIMKSDRKRDRGDDRRHAPSAGAADKLQDGRAG